MINQFIKSIDECSGRFIVEKMKSLNEDFAKFCIGKARVYTTPDVLACLSILDELDIKKTNEEGENAWYCGRYRDTKIYMLSDQAA